MPRQHPAPDLTAIQPYTATVFRPKPLPPYDYNNDGEVLVMPFEKYCRFPGCAHRKRFKAFRFLHYHLRRHHGVHVYGPRGYGTLPPEERVRAISQRGIPPPDLWANVTWDASSYTPPVTQVPEGLDSFTSSGTSPESTTAADSITTEEDVDD